MDDFFEIPNPKSKKGKFKARSKSRQSRYQQSSGDFTCLHCSNPVSANSLLSGVNNRNHCPICLWSRHLDMFQAGDRLSACKGMMEPVGLTLKQTNKKYGPAAQGELMLIHLCGECGKASINRIAADDVSEKILEIYQESLSLDPEIGNRLAQEGICVLGPDDRETVEVQLFGRAAVHFD